MQWRFDWRAKVIHPDQYMPYIPWAWSTSWYPSHISRAIASCLLLACSFLTHWGNSVASLPVLCPVSIILSLPSGGSMSWSSSGSYFRMMLWRAAHVEKTLAWTSRVYSGGITRILKHCLMTPKTHSITFWAEVCCKLNNSSGLLGLFYKCNENIVTNNGWCLPWICMSPLSKMIPHTMIWHKKSITGRKSSIGEVIFIDRDAEICETSIVKHLRVCYWSFPATLNLNKWHLEITCRKSIGGECSIAVMKGIMIGCCCVGMSMEVGAIHSTESVLEIQKKLGV